MRCAKVAELADAPDLGSGGETLGGSTPPFRTNFCWRLWYCRLYQRPVVGPLRHSHDLASLNRTCFFSAPVVGGAALEASRIPRITCSGIPVSRESFGKENWAWVRMNSSFSSAVGSSFM